MAHPTSVLRDSSTHNVNVPSDPAAATYSYDINLGTPTMHLPRSYVPNAHALGMSLPHGSPLYAHHQLGALSSPGLGFNDFDDMKRALDVSGLPMNPLTGAAPIIDPQSGPFENAVPSNKKARYSPITVGSMASPALQINHQQHPGTFTPGQSLFNAGGMASPIHMGPMLQGGNGVPATPNGPGRMGGNALSVPQTPMGVMGFNMGSPYNMAFPTSPIMSPSMNPGVMTGNYGPAAAAAAAAAAGNTTGRTVYVGGLPADASVDELLNLVRFGPIENVRLLPERSCVFISFLDGSTAAAFHADAQVKKLALHGQELKIGWGKASTLAAPVHSAVQNQQATRNVFVGNLADTTTEQDLRDELQRFGPIDQVKIVRDKNIGFVHFLGIATAMKVVKELPLQTGWTDKRVNYGKDRCAYVPKAQQAAVQMAQQQALAAVHSQHAQVMPGSPYQSFTPMTPSFSNFSAPNTPGFASPIFPSNAFPQMTGGNVVDPTAAANQLGNRNVYLGNIHPDTTTEELCNNIRGGQLQQIKHMQDKNCAFVTFVSAENAMSFYTYANTLGITVNTRKLKVGWGKHSGSLPPAMLQAIQSGASRNVYIGSIQDFEAFTDEKLRKDFGEFGEIEMINFLKEKGAAFINFMSIQSAQSAIEGVKQNPNYANLRISFGKDRCANVPRPMNGTPGAPGMRNTSMRNVSGNSASGNANGTGSAVNHSPNDNIALAIAAAEAKMQQLQQQQSPPPPQAPLQEAYGSPAVAMEAEYEQGEVKEEGSSPRRGFRQSSE